MCYEVSEFNSLTNYGNEILCVTLTEFEVEYEVKVLNRQQGISHGERGQVLTNVILDFSVTCKLSEIWDYLDTFSFSPKC